MAGRGSSKLNELVSIPRMIRINCLQCVSQGRVLAEESCPSSLFYFSPAYPVPIRILILHENQKLLCIVYTSLMFKL